MRRALFLFLVPFVIASCGGGTPAGPSPVNCTITVPQHAMNVTATGGASAIPVSAGTTCAWTVTSSQPWLTITSGTGATGAATVTFTVAENTGAERQATVTIGAVQVVVTQAAGTPPVALVAPAALTMTQGVAFNAVFTAAGGVPPYTFSLETGVGFPPIGVVLAPNGTLAGTPAAAGNATFGVCATDTAGRTDCRRFTVTVAPAQGPVAGGDAFLGNWSGTIVLRVGCFQPLPANFPWTGTFRRNGNNIELVANVPRALVVNETIPVTVTGQRLSFNILFDSRYTFVADFSADFRSLNGTFTGGNCNVPPTVVNPSGDWNGTKQ